MSQVLLYTILQVLNYVTGIIIYDLTGITGVNLWYSRISCTSYFRFLDDVKYKSKESIDFSPLWELMKGLDPDIKFISENVSWIANFVDVSCLIKNDIFDNLYLTFTTNLHIRSLTCITAAVTHNTLKIILFCHWDKELFMYFPRIRNNILKKWNLR